MSKLIFESPILQEAEVVQRNARKAVFRMTMQTVDEINQNRRLYPKNVLSEAMGNIQEIITRKSFYGELDHPIPTGDQRIDGLRQTTVLLKNVSHVVREYEFRGNRLIGELETTDTPNGRILLGLVREGLGIGLSMRGMAELDQKDRYNIVRSPLIVVAFDSVSRPSHKSAIVDFNEMRFESYKVLTENYGSQTICTKDGMCFLANYFDKLVEAKMIQFEESWI